MRLLVILGVLLAAIGAIALWPVQPEEQVKDVVRDAVRAFSDGRAGDCLSHFDDDFVDRSASREIDRNMIRAALLGAFGGRGRAQDLVALLDEESLRVTTLDPEAGRASASFDVRVLELPAGTEYVDGGELVWAVTVDAELRRDEDDETWRFASSEHRTLEGQAPYR